MRFFAGVSSQAIPFCFSELPVTTPNFDKKPRHFRTKAASVPRSLLHRPAPMTGKRHRGFFSASLRSGAET
jgi:hypothetical protein